MQLLPFRLTWQDDLNEVVDSKGPSEVQNGPNEDSQVVHDGLNEDEGVGEGEGDDADEGLNEGDYNDVYTW